MAEHKPNQAADTGHEWDGIRELTNDPPRWWLIAFYLSFFWVIVYFLIYPAIPLINGATKGLTGWTQIGEYKDAVKQFDTMRKPYIEKLSGMPAQQIVNDPEMLNFANSYSKAIFGDNCAGCHGTNGQGVSGKYPALNDDDWLYGGTLDNIIETITNGRHGSMPAFGATMNDAQINALTEVVIALSEGKATPQQMELFNQASCGACHGPDAKGMAALGSANLTDKIWRFGSSHQEVVNTIKYGVNQADNKESRNANMPTFSGKLTADQIKLLAVKVWSLGGGQKQ